MDVSEWLRQLALRIPNLPPAAATRLAGYAPRLRADFPANAFSAVTLEDVAEGLTKIPAYGDLKEALASVAPSPPAKAEDDDRMADHWLRFFVKRLGEGANRATLVSMCRAHVPFRHVDRVMRAAFPQEWQAEEERKAEVARDKARGLRVKPSTMPGWTVASLRMPSGPHGPSGAQPPEPERPAIKPSYLSPEQLARLRKEPTP